MSLLDLHSDDMISAAEAAPPVAPRKQEPAFSSWRAFKGAVKAVPAAVAEVVGSTADVLGAFGGVSAATGASAGGMFSTGTEAERKQTADAAKKLREQGPDYRSEAGGLFRGVAKDYMPDPQTAHGAEVAVAEFVRLATKAVAGGVTMGPLGGAVVAGAEEGFTASDKLAEQGVDVNTRTQVGAVTGAVTALGFALPVAGRTWAQTAGLALAGGPASFMAQNAGTREILLRADYGQLADQYDPFDPVGLTLSTMIPLGFGAMAMRGAARRAAAGQPVPDVAPVAPEVVDAARVQLLRENVDAYRVTPPEDFAGAQAHEAAVSQALDQLANGQRVDIAQPPDPVALPITEAVAARLEAVRSELDALRLLDTPGDVATTASRAPAGPAQALDAARAVEVAPAQPARFDIDTIAREAGELLSDGRSPGEIIGRMQASGQTVAPELQNMLVGLSEFGRRLPELVDQFRALEARATDAPPQNLIADAVERMRAGQPVDAPAAKVSDVQTRLDAEIVGNPTALETKLPIAFDDAGKVTETMTAREYLDAVAAEAAQETADANLLKIAANCFLTTGA